jgi:hypothetical protein
VGNFGVWGFYLLGLCVAVWGSERAGRQWEIPWRKPPPTDRYAYEIHAAKAVYTTERNKFDIC